MSVKLVYWASTKPKTWGFIGGQVALPFPFCQSKTHVIPARSRPDKLFIRIEGPKPKAQSPKSVVQSLSTKLGFIFKVEKVEFWIQIQIKLKVKEFLPLPHQWKANTNCYKKKSCRCCSYDYAMDPLINFLQLYSTILPKP